MARLQRRTVLAGAIASLTAACTGASTKRDAEPELAPDVLLAVQALTLVQERLAALQAFRRRRLVTGVIAVHREHARVLVDLLPDEAMPAAAPMPGPQTLVQLAASEQQLHAVLTRLAVRADAGVFARLLASMAAASAQQTAILRRAAA